MDEQSLEQQWIRKHQRMHRIRQREICDVSTKSYYNYYRDLIKWMRKQPMPPEYPKKLQNQIKHFGSKDIRSVKHFYRYSEKELIIKRKELQEGWDIFIQKFAKYKVDYLQWFAEKPKRTGFISELSDGIMYILDKGMSVTKESIEHIEQVQMTKSKIEMYHPITKELVIILDM